MKARKILESEIGEMKISSLPTRPTAPVGMGGLGYTSGEMKAAFDKLPLFIIARYNELVDSILTEGDESIVSVIPSGIRESHSLRDLIDDVSNGNFSSYLSCGERSLLAELYDIKERLLALESGRARSTYGGNDESN